MPLAMSVVEECLELAETDVAELAGVQDEIDCLAQNIGDLAQLWEGVPDVEEHGVALARSRNFRPRGETNPEPPKALDNYWNS